MKLSDRLEWAAWWTFVVLIGLPLTALDMAADWVLGYRNGASRHDSKTEARRRNREGGR
jgi:hypothetical protein